MTADTIHGAVENIRATEECSIWLSMPLLLWERQRKA